MGILKPDPQAHACFLPPVLQVAWGRCPERCGCLVITCLSAAVWLEEVVGWQGALGQRRPWCQALAVTAIRAA